MSEFWQHFHWLRPAWLLLLPLVWLLAAALWRYLGRDRGWQGLVAPELLRYLVDTEQRRRQSWPFVLLAMAWTLALLALAGPTWKQLPQPVLKPPHALVVMLDLSPSMMAEDIQPNRLTHARYRLIDLLRGRKEGVTGLVVYAGDAHVLAPLSDDRTTLLTLVPSLSPALMPVPGSQVEAAVAEAVDLLQAGGYSQGDLVLITDGVTVAAEQAVNERLQATDYRLSVMSVGTAEGAPIPWHEGELAKDERGNIQLAKVDQQALQRLAESHGGIYQPLRYDGTDVSRMLAYIDRRYQQQLLLDSAQHLVTSGQQPGDTTTQRTFRTFDQWQDAGIWLVLLLLPAVLLAHRRGWLLLVLLCPLLSQPQQALAAEASLWDKLWLNDQQRTQQAYQRQDYESVRAQSADPRWQGSAAYRQGDFQAAVEAFRRQAEQHPDNADSYYNLGNALARSDDYPAALTAYEKALELDPQMADAQANKALVQSLLEQSKQEQSKQDRSKQEQPQPEQSRQKQSQPESSQQQQSQQQSQSEQSAPPPENQRGEGADQSPPSPGQQAQGGQQDRQLQPPAAEAETDEPVQQLEADRQQSQQAEAKPQADTPEQQQNASTVEQSSDQPTEEERQLQRWLRQLPDDPGGLLRRKFEHQYREKLRAYQQGQWQPPEETRW